MFNTIGGVEDTRLEAKDAKKIQGPGQPFRGQTLSRPRTQAQVLSKKKKKVFTKIFQAISTKKRFPKNFSSASQNFNNSKNTAVLEAKDFKMCPRGLHLCLIPLSVQEPCIQSHVGTKLEFRFLVRCNSLPAD